MRVLLVSNMYPSPEWPAYGVFVRNFESGLISRGGEVDLAVIRGRGNSRVDKIKKYFLFFIDFYRFFLFRGYDLVYVHYVAHSILPLLPILLFKNVKFVVNAHGEDLLPRTSVERLIFKLSQWAIRRASMVVVPSKFFEEIAAEFCSRDKIFVSPSGGVDLNIFNPLSSTLLLKHPRCEGGVTTFGYVSRIDPGKGWETLLQAIIFLHKGLPSLSLVLRVVGDGSEVDRLNQMILDFGLNGRVEYLGSLDQKRLPDFYRSLDAFVFPTELPESLGLVGLEALACGVPAICTRVGGITSYMEDGVNGFLVSPGDARELANKMADFAMMDFEEVVQLRRSAVETASNYDSEAVSSCLYSKLVSVLKG